ncbi:L,D-transpeptidase family protein [Rhizobium helianthi]|uniref:L,D-transpeptidase family protein n=1 Tax=Rhizobium helianthi TaxID=1132695 RepID=A0ABW4LZT1_9HYPH
MFRSVAAALALLAGSVSPAVAATDVRTLQIIVSKASQSLAVYDDGEVIATSRVSTGKSGHDTPTGIFSILEKRKFHKSNIYSNAPMPWMQRLTWSGIALHESSSVPNYPASHGCVRLPAAFARSLYQMTGRGVHVIIAEEDVQPRAVDHAFLFRPASTSQNKLLSDVPLRSSTSHEVTEQVEVAMHMPSKPNINPTYGSDASRTGRDREPLRIMITRRGERELIADVQQMLTYLGFDAGPADGIMGETTRSAIAGFKRWKELPQKGPLLSDPMLKALYAAAAREPAPAGQLLIRQGFEPLLSEAVAIKSPDVALGTHFYQLTKLDEKTGQAQWQGLTLPDRLPEATRKRLGITSDTPTTDDVTQSVLDRIILPDPLRSRIEQLISTGSSVTITDNGPSHETTKGTDFITLTR